MGIQRTGSGQSTPPTAPAGDAHATGVRPTGKPFEVSPSGATATTASATGAAEVKASPALEGVRSGALDAKGYVDAKVSEATAHLSHLSPTQLQAVQSVVRDQLLSDPHLRELVERATGAPAPKADEE